MGSKLDCIVIGYNELPFDQYESFLRNFGENTEAYRDLKFSFVDLGNRKLDYVGLMNHVGSIARGSNAFRPLKATNPAIFQILQPRISRRFSGEEVLKRSTSIFFNMRNSA